MPILPQSEGFTAKNRENDKISFLNHGEKQRKFINKE